MIAKAIAQKIDLQKLFSSLFGCLISVQNVSRHEGTNFNDLKEVFIYILVVLGKKL